MTEKELYYAFTNTQVINMINIKNSIHPDTNADIYIIDNGRISKELVKCIRDGKVFDNIKYLKHYPYSQLKKTVQKLPTILWKVTTFMFTLINYSRYQHIFLKENERVYGALFLSGFWGDGCYIIKHYIEYNPNLQVYFVEEGTANYSHTITELCYLFESLHPAARLLWKITTGGNKVSDIKQFIQLINGMYLYNPDDYLPPKEKPLLKIPPISNKSTLEILSNTIPQEIYERYINNDIIYFMQNQNTDINQYKQFRNYISEIIDIENLRIIIKQHPDFDINHMKFKDISLLKNTIIDRENYLLEGIYAKIDLKNKILITRDSSAVMYPQYMFSKEPYVIFTYKLYSNYYQENHDRLDNLTQNLENYYTDKSRIYVPTTINELKDFLKQCLQT